MTVSEAQERITAWEFVEWIAYWNLEPFGPQIDDARWAGLTAAAWNGPGNLKRPVASEKFLYGEKPQKKELSTTQQMQLFRHMKTGLPKV